MSNTPSKYLPLQEVDGTYKDPNELTISEIRDKIGKSLGILNYRLFDQAAHEANRLSLLTKFTSEIENELFSIESLQTMSRPDKLMLYQIASQNQQLALKFMMSLNVSAAKASEILTSIEKMQAQDPKESKPIEKSNPQYKDIKARVLAQIKAKSTESP